MIELLIGLFAVPESSSNSIGHAVRVKSSHQVNYRYACGYRDNLLPMWPRYIAVTVVACANIARPNVMPIIQEQ